jgi:hypothetical protein
VVARVSKVAPLSWRRVSATGSDQPLVGSPRRCSVSSKAVARADAPVAEHQASPLVSLARDPDPRQPPVRVNCEVVIAAASLNLETVASLLLGAVLATLGGMATELWKQRNSRRAAARLVYHEVRLNYGAVLGRRMGDVSADALKRQLRRTAWQSQADKLAVLGGFEEYQKLWGTYQAFEALAAADAENPSNSVLDAVLDSVQDVLERVGDMAGVPPDTFSDDRRVRLLVGLSAPQRILAWQDYEREGRYTTDPDQWLRARVVEIEPSSRDAHQAPEAPLATRRANDSGPPTESPPTPGVRSIALDEAGRVAVGLVGTVLMSAKGNALTINLPPPARVLEDLTPTVGAGWTPRLEDGTPHEVLVEPQAAADQALAWEVAISAPVVARVLPNEGERTPELQDLLDADPSSDHYLLRFACSIRNKSEYAYLDLDLGQAGSVDMPPPIAEALLPELVVREVATTRSVELALGSTLQFSLHGNTPPARSDDAAIQAVGLLTSRPGWRLSGSRAEPILGLYRFAAVLRVPRGANRLVVIAAIDVGQRGKWLKRRHLHTQRQFDVALSGLPPVPSI